MDDVNDNGQLLVDICVERGLSLLSAQDDTDGIIAEMLKYGEVVVDWMMWIIIGV